MSRKASKTSPRNYFTTETQEYIIQYNASTDPAEKEKIFTEHLYYPFYKLAECIIHSFKFYHVDVEKIEDLKLDIVRMIWQEKIGMFDPSRGTKAFSYFGTIIKRWLIAYNNNNYRTEKKKVSVELCENYFSIEENISEKNTMTLSDVVDYWVVSVSKRLDTIFEKEQDKLVANAILTVFSARKDLEEFGKRAICVYVREITGCEQPCITRVLKILKADFYSEICNLRKKDVALDESYF